MVLSVASEAALVAVGASGGALCRWAAHELYVKWHVNTLKASHPPLWGIVVVNVCASGVLGFIAGEEKITRRKQMLVGTGFCGGMSTFSTFAIESAKLLSTNPRLAVGYIVVTNIGCILAAGTTYAWRLKKLSRC